MCGFVGFTGDVENKEQVLTSMMDRIVHRGPDMGDTFFAPGVALGFRRLSILDLTPAGSQPMSNEDGSVVIVFNGEIYNFMELRGELEAKGYTFHCGADTESLLHGYEEWGEEIVDKLVRFRTVGDISCTAPVESDADTVAKIVVETATTTITERGATRLDDQTSEASMEQRKKEGYF